MRTPRTRQLLGLCATVFAVVMIGAEPASADVDCVDLKSRGAAQSYFEGRPEDLDGLDADGDGQACEANDPNSYGEWALPGLAALLLGALVVNGVRSKRQTRLRIDQQLPLQPPVPAQRSGVVLAQSSEQSPEQSPEQSSEKSSGRSSLPGVSAAPGRKRALLESAPGGTLEDLAHALRLVPNNKRMSIVELYAVAHHTGPQEVLDALVAEISDVGLQRWASTGHRAEGQETFRAGSRPSGPSSPRSGPVRES